MNTRIPFNSNPLASNPNTAIPFNVTRPAASRVDNLGGGDELLLEMPDPVNLIMVASTGLFTLVDGEELVTQDGWSINAFEGDAEIYYNFIVGPKILIIAGSEDIELTINRQVIWSALANIGTYTRS